MNSKILTRLIVITLALAGAALRAQPAFFQAVTNLNPAAYWPMQETVQPPGADVETNLGSLGAIANAYYSSTNVDKGFSPATGDGVTADMFASGFNGGFLAVPLTSSRVVLPAGPFTVETWVYPTNTSGLITIMAQTGPIGTGGLNGGANSAGWSLNQNFLPSLGTTLNDANSVVGWSFHVYNGVGSTGGAEAAAAFNFSLNTWYHIVGVFDGANCTVYVNGVNATTEQIPMTGSYVQDTWDPLTIGCGRELNNNRFGGALNEVAVYTKALSSTQVANHYNAQYSGSYAATILGDSPLMYWRLDAPAYTPANPPYPAAANYGSDGNAGGVYLPGTLPGAAGPSLPGLGTMTNAVAFNGIGTDATNTISIFTNGVLTTTGVAGPAIVITNSDNALNMTNKSITAMVWFKANPVDDRFQGLLGRGNSSWRLSLDGTAGKVHWNPGPGGELTSSRLYNDGLWHFVVGVYASAGAASPAGWLGTNSLYVDGELDTTTTFTNSAGFTPLPCVLGGAPDYFTSGNGNAYSQRYFSGSLAHAAYFTNALTGPQVAVLYTNATGAAVPPPFIYGQPITGRTNFIGGPGSYVFFGVNAGGTPALGYQWYFNSSSNYSGATALVDNVTHYTNSQTLQVTVTNLSAADSGYYYVVVTNNYGSVTSLLASLSVATTPVITAQTPSGAFSLFAGQSYSLSVTATGATPLTYQWFTNGVADTTAGLTATYALAGVPTALSGETYQCVVTNVYGPATNALATLTVNPLPASLTGSSYGSAMLALSPTAYWPMHESAPTAHADVETNYGTLGALGNGYFADWVNPIVTHQAPGAIAGDPDPAVTFYNTNTDCLIVPHSSPLATIQEPYTLEAWVKPFTDNTDGTSYQVIMGQGLATGLNGNAATKGGFALQYAGTSSTFSLVIQNGATSYEQKTAAIYPPGVWYHLVVTYVGTNVTYYINGQQASFGAAAAGSLTTMAPDSWSPLTIGAGRWGTGGSAQPFIGSLDEVAVYTNILTATQIQNHYAAGTTVGGNYYQTVQGDSPLLYYRMDSPAYVIPPVSTWSVLTNYGTLALNGVYHPGALPGGAAGPGEAGSFLTGLSGTNAMQGNGVSSYADAGLAPTLNPAGYTSFSYTAWFKGNPSDARTYNCLMAANDDTWRAQINSGSGKGQIHGDEDLTSPNVVNDGNWHQFVMTAQAVLTNSTIGVFTNILYIDGVPVISGVSGATNTPASVPAEVLIGDEMGNTNSELSGGGRSFAGAICEAAFFYGTVLNATQVQHLYNAAGVPPFFTQQPASSTNNQGVIYTNTVAAGGSATLVYQWYLNGAPLTGQTNTTLVYNPLLPADAGSYYVVVTNTSGSITSAVANVVVYSSPTITSQFPATYTNLYTLYAGANPSFSLTANGAVPLYYRWYANGVLVGSVNNTNPFVTVSNIQAGLLTNYCVVSNFVGSSTSMVWTATVLAAPTAPFPRQVLALSPAGYWRLNEPDDGLGDGNPNAVCHDYISGDDGLYTNTALGSAGYDANTDPTETSAGFGQTTFINSDAGSINGLDFTAPPGTNSEFTVSAWVYGEGSSGTGGIVSKGYYYGEELDLDCGGTSDAYRFEVRSSVGTAYNANSTVLPNDQTWHLLVGVCDEANGLVSLYIDGQLAGSTAIPSLSGITNSATVPITIGSRPTSATSGANNQFIGFVNDVAIYKYALTANQVAALYGSSGVAPFFTQTPPATATVNGGASLTLPAAVAGTPVLGYQWTDQNAGTNVATGVTNGLSLTATLTVSNVPGSWNGDTLLLTVTNAYGTTNYSVALTVNTNPPAITQNLPVQVPLVSGKTYTYSVAVTGPLPFSYEWLANGTPVAGQTGATYTVTAGGAGSSTTYQVVITNYSGAVTSSVSTLTAIPQLTNPYATSVLAYGPVGYWPLQETNPPAAATVETNYGSLGALGNAYYAITNATNVTFDLPGIVPGDSAVGLTGLNGTPTPTFAFVPRITPALTLQPPLSLECWLNASSAAFGDLIGEGGSGLNSPSGGGNAGGLRLSYGGTLQLYVFTGSGITRPDIGTPNNMTFNTWHHCVATYDGTNAILYVDGTEQASGALTMATDTWTPLTIGAGFWQGPGPIRGFAGTEDEVAIYTNVLSPQQVNNDYLAGTTPGSNYVQTVLDNDPLLYYRMDATGYTNTPAGLCPAAVNYGTAPVNGAYLSGTRPGYVSGPPNAALTNDVALPVNGLTACVDAGYDPTFNPTGTQPFTAMVWFKGNPGDGRLQTLMGHGTNWTLNLDGTTGYVDWGQGAGTVISSTILNDGNWHHVAGVYTGSANYLYVDGALNGTATVTGGLTGDPGHDVYLGGNANDVLVVNNQQFFAGSLAQAAFYTNALTAAQIQQIYTLAIPPAVNTNPTNIVCSVAGSLLTLSWPADHTGWVLQAQTNGLNAGLGTNWVNVSSSSTTNKVVMPVNPTNASVFYRLIYP